MTWNGIRIATYNVHKCVGIDRRMSVERIARVLREVDADIVALQEVVVERTAGPNRGVLVEPARSLIRTRLEKFGQRKRARARDQAEHLAELTGFAVVVGPAIDEPGHVYGNVVLTRLPIVGYENFDISSHRREPRACLRVDIALPGGGAMHLYNTHFGTSHPERVEQSRRLVESGILAGSHPEHPQVLVGDFNDWFAGAPTRLLGDHFHEATRLLKPTYPALAPVLRLDRIYVNQHVRVRRIEAHGSRAARVASDHIPIVAVLDAARGFRSSKSE